ncbi:MAG: alpha/beta hydrolase [Gammaproteobacteria bacterium]|nr:alpha/beta hydrolase [Gammaproteobacteria bacterium]MCW8909990.1 alpha/beta hydrolase [Gammaproteobacteria bacterium]
MITDIWKIALVIIIAYAALSALVYFKQASIIYYPELPGRKITATPEKINLSFDDVEFFTEDRIKLHGWFIPHDQARGTLLFFHGNAGNISHRLDSIEIFHRLNLNVFIFDYRGYGQSEGRTTEQGTYRDAEAAWRYLTESRNINPREIIIFGRSLGASIAAWLASQHQPASLIVESGFSSIPAMAKRLYPFLPVGWLAHFKYNTRDYVSRTSCPVLIAHSTDDEIIPFDEGREIYRTAREPRRFYEMRGGHNDGFIISGSDYRNELRSFIQASLTH